MHFFRQKRHNIVLNDLVYELYKFMPRNHLIMIYVQFLEVLIIVLLGRQDAFQLKVALDKCLKLLPVNLAVVFLVGAVKDLL